MSSSTHGKVAVFSAGSWGTAFSVVLADAGDLTGVVVDDFGCHDTRLTADPHSLPAGADGPGGAVDGVLQGGPRVLQVLGVGRGA